MVKTLVDLLGIEETIRRGTCGPAAAEEAEEVEGSLSDVEGPPEWVSSSSAWLEDQSLQWRTDPEQGSA